MVWLVTRSEMLVLNSLVHCVPINITKILYGICIITATIYIVVLLHIFAIFSRKRAQFLMHLMMLLHTTGQFDMPMIYICC